MPVIRFTLYTAPRTKKTHSQIVSMGRPCASCGKKPITKLIPSEQFAEFEAQVLSPVGTYVKRALQARGVRLPIEGPVSVRALIFRQANTGDWLGYTQALGDVLQAEVWECRKCGKQVRDLPRPCPCGAPVTQRRLARKGLGIIVDDRQIVHWDGTRLMKDAAKPRIEIEIRQLEPGLF